LAGYASLGGEIVNQIGTQYGKGNFGLGELDLIRLGTSAFVTNPYTKFIQGNMGTLISYSTNDGFGGDLGSKKVTNGWIFQSVINANISTYFPGGIAKDFMTGAIQGVFDKTEENGDFK
jgi:hypothetical protein